MKSKNRDCFGKTSDCTHWCCIRGRERERTCAHFYSSNRAIKASEFCLEMYVFGACVSISMCWTSNSDSPEATFCKVQLYKFTINPNRKWNNFVFNIQHVNMTTKPLNPFSKYMAACFWCELNVLVFLLGCWTTRSICVCIRILCVCECRYLSMLVVTYVRVCHFDYAFVFVFSSMRKCSGEQNTFLSLSMCLCERTFSPSYDILHIIYVLFLKYDFNIHFKHLKFLGI